ncbi:MAG: ribosomal protein [Bacteroidetes bacterium]|nr:ribosomal protein [Bacteroidota bacterium]
MVVNKTFVSLHSQIKRENIKIQIMYAIVEIAGQQFKVQKDQKLFVHRLQAEEGEQMSFDAVMLKDADGSITIGTPTIEGSSVKATVLKHLKGDKVLVFKKKRRKGYQKMNGHRQYLSQIQVTEIL